MVYVQIVEGNRKGANPMSEYLSKKAVLEWLKEQQKQQEENRDRLEIDHQYWEYHEGASDYLSLAVEEFESGAFDADDSEIQRLRAAVIKLHETLNTYWQGDCEKADVVAVQSKLCDVLGADRDDELYGDWTDERCPKCGADLLGNKVGDKWCSLVGCDYSINAPEKVGTKEWRHKYLGAEWSEVEGDENA